MTDKEHKDLYIAAAVGGLGLILILLYMFGGATPVSAAENASGSPLPGVTASRPDPGLSDYNYNIAPFNPAPLLPYGKNGSGLSLGGCCDECGPKTGNQFNNVNVAQFQTLLGTGAG